MSDLLNKLTAGRQHLQPRWTVARALRVQDLMQQRRRRRTTRRAASAVVLSALCAYGIVQWALREPTTAAPHVELALQTIELFDGSRVQFDPDTSAVSVTRDGLDDSGLSLDRGRAEFDIVHRPSRRFAVQIEGVTIEVLGTQFSVERSERTAWISVTHGKVAVRSAEGAALLLDGQELIVPLRAVAPQKRIVLQAMTPEPIGPSRERLIARAPEPLVVSSTHRHTGEDTVAQALQRADDLQRNGEAEDAVALLRTVFIEDRRDSRAPSAAFTAGRLLADALHRPKDAASAFRVARLLAPLGPLAEDAWLRELESHIAARALEEAHAVGFDYLHRFPLGAHTSRVRQLLGDLPGEL